MEFNICVNTGLNGNITIEDYSLEYDQYIQEDDEYQKYGYYKYSECKTINIITKIDSEKSTLKDVLFHNHDQLIEDPIKPVNQLYLLEKTDFTIKEDGYYNINHIILPTRQWLNDIYLQNEDYKNQFESTIYIIGDDNILYKYINGELITCPAEEIIKVNCEGTTIEKCTIDVFYTGFLQMCYINYCKKLFQKLTKNCNYACIPKDVKDITYARDFLWMVLNIIDYQISFKQYEEAQRILETVNYCGGFCQNQKLNVGSSTECGCFKN